LRYALTNSADINEDTLGPSGISNGRGAWSSIDPHNLPKNAPGVRWLRTPEAVRSALVFSSKALAENKAIILGANRRRPGSGKQYRRELKAALLFDPLGGRIAFAKYHSPSCVGLPSGGAGERICGRVATGIPARSVGFF